MVGGWQATVTTVYVYNVYGALPNPPPQKNENDDSYDTMILKVRTDTKAFLYQSNGKPMCLPSKTQRRFMRKRQYKGALVCVPVVRSIDIIRLMYAIFYKSGPRGCNGRVSIDDDGITRCFDLSAGEYISYHKLYKGSGGFPLWECVLCRGGAQGCAKFSMMGGDRKSARRFHNHMVDLLGWSLPCDWACCRCCRCCCYSPFPPANFVRCSFFPRWRLCAVVYDGFLTCRCRALS